MGRCMNHQPMADTTLLLIIHSAIIEGYTEKSPDPSTICHWLLV